MRRGDDRLGGSAWLGANFWSRTGGPLMWRSYDPEVVTEELSVLAEHGLNLTRSFFYWPDFQPEPDRLDERMVARYRDFLDRHQGLGMSTVPTFIVGHMSGENWDPSWRAGRDLYRDVWLVARQAWYVRDLVSRFADHPAVAGWLISNEMPLYGGKAPADVVSSWAQLMVDAVRAGGGRQPVSLGDGAWGVCGTDSGYDLRRLSTMVDWNGPHTYRMEDDPVRQHLGPAFVCELAGLAGRPVVLEEFGLSTAYSSAEHAGHYYRQVLHSTLLAGATGWMAWNNTDYDHLVGQRPYSHHPFEMHFGITTSDGKPKTPLLELRKFADTLEQLEFDRCERLPADAALVVSSYVDTDYPFTSPQDAPYVFQSLRQCYVAAKEADLPVAFEHESDGLAEGYRLYLLPSAKQLTAPGWHRLEALAAAGATVYVSYGAGQHDNQRGPWWSHLDDMFGVEHQLSYGLVDPVTDDEVRFTFSTEFGSLAEGDELVFTAAGNAHSRVFLPVRATTAEVVATDQHGRPALLVRQHGAGRMVLCTYPIEHMASALPRANPEHTCRLYDALAELAEVRRPLVIDDPRVSVDGLRHADGRQLLCLLNLSAEEVTVLDDITLPPYGATWIAPAPSVSASATNASSRSMVTVPTSGSVVWRAMECW